MDPKMGQCERHYTKRGIVATDWFLGQEERCRPKAVRLA
jgi:hypothetical protein